MKFNNANEVLATKVGSLASNAAVLGALQTPKREPDPKPALDKDVQGQPIPNTRMAVSIIGIRKRILDSDNFQGAAKHLRDLISRELYIDDADPRIEWHYHQIKGRPEGVIVSITQL